MDICWLPWSALSAIFEHFRCLVNPTGYPDYKSPLCIKRLQSRKEVSTSQTRWGCYTAPREARGFEIRWLEKSSLSVRPCVRASVRAYPISLLWICNFLCETSYLKIDDFGRKYAILRLISCFLSTIFDENKRFCGSLPVWKSTVFDENTRFCSSFRIWKSIIFD